MKLNKLMENKNFCTACGELMIFKAMKDGSVANTHKCTNRPKCSHPECNTNTCVQSIANNYQPTCLHHFFEDRGWLKILKEERTQRIMTDIAYQFG